MIADLSFAWLFWLVIRWPILREQVNMNRMIKHLTNVSPVRSRSSAIRRASFSAILMFSLVSATAEAFGMRFLPAEWAGIVIGVTMLVWRRELFS